MLRASANSLRLTQLYGSAAESQASASAPYSYLFEVDGVRILLDCGWNDTFETEYLDRLKPYLATVDAVLLSTPEINSCGALPFVMEHLPPGAFVAAAGSTAKIGLHGLLHPFLYQFPSATDFVLKEGEVFTQTVDKIYSAFRNIREPYGGKVVVKNKDVSVECLCTFAGRMLGGYGWKIQYQVDEVFYCPDFSLKPSYALKRCVVPTTSNVLCLEGFSFQWASSGKKYDDQLEVLFRDIQRTLRSGSDVLIPITVAGRGLEMLNTVVRLLEERGGDKYKVMLAALQAREILDKAATMTEALQDDITLQEQTLFSNVIACRTADEVVNIEGPKVCLADGVSLNYGIAAELLPYFLPTNSHGSENLIVFTEEPSPGSNAALIAESTQHEHISYTVVKRSRLNKEELEEHYLQQEREVEQQRKHLEEEGCYLIEEEEIDVADDDGFGLTEGGEIETKELLSTKERPTVNTPGLYLPPYMSFTSKHLHFPSLENNYTLQTAAMKGESIAYGLPVSDEEQLILRKRAPVTNQSDEGPEGIVIHNDAQQEANIPSKVFRVQQTCPRNCKVLHSDLTGFPDAATMKGLLKSKFTFAKKIVAIRSTADDWRLMAQYCRNEKSMKCGESVLFPPGPGIPIELATQVLSYTVQLDPELAQQLPHSLRRVRETNSDGMWEVSWINGELRSSSAGTAFKEPEAMKLRLEDTAFTLAALSGNKVQACAEEREVRDLQSGSFFVGDLDLMRLRDSTRRDTGFLSDFHRKAPMLVFDDGVCVRKGADGTITVSSMAGPTMFDIRRAVYRQYSQTL